MPETAPVEAVPPPVARIYGEALNEIPPDLFIPPEALRVVLEAFEGPLDLLLYLIRRHNLDVLDIPMARLTAQYMTYVEAMRAAQWELAAEYLLMAALLVEIKSRLLLPRPAAEEKVEEDPRAELVRRLLEYEQMKVAARRLDELPQRGRDFLVAGAVLERVVVERLPEVRAEDLREAWLGLLARARLNAHHRVRHEPLSVRERMTVLLRRLRGAGFQEFTALFDATAGVPELVVTLLAVLELVRESLVDLTQQGAFSAIYVKLRDGIVAG